MLRHTRRPCKTVPSLSPNRSLTMPSPEPPSSNDHFRPVTYPPGLFCYPSSRFGPLPLSPLGRGRDAMTCGRVGFAHHVETLHGAVLRRSPERVRGEFLCCGSEGPLI